MDSFALPGKCTSHLGDTAQNPSRPNMAELLPIACCPVGEFLEVARVPGSWLSWPSQCYSHHAEGYLASSAWLCLQVSPDWQPGPAQSIKLEASPYLGPTRIPYLLFYFWSPSDQCGQWRSHCPQWPTLPRSFHAVPLLRYWFSLENLRGTKQFCTLASFLF